MNRLVSSDIDAMQSSDWVNVSYDSLRARMWYDEKDSLFLSVSHEIDARIDVIEGMHFADELLQQSEVSLVSILRGVKVLIKPQ